MCSATSRARSSRGCGNRRGAVGLDARLQERRDLLDDAPTRGFECTFSVDDVDDMRASIIAAGGRILMERFTISGVGHLTAFEDPGGNPVLAMQHDEDAT